MNSKCAPALILLGILSFFPCLYAVTDQELTEKVRQSLAADPALSTVADRVKIKVENGKVNLKGSVDTEQQRLTVEKHATDAAGPGNITDDITIQAARARKHKSQ